MDSEFTDEDLERFKRRDYNDSARRQISWDSYAVLMKRAADHLLQAHLRYLNNKPPLQVVVEGGPGWEEANDFGLINVYYMLMGLSIENVAKGIIMVNHPEYLTEAGITKIDRHDIRNLMIENGINEFREYDDILSQLEKYVLWMGRYPISKSYDRHEVVPDPIDLDRLNELYNIFYKRLRIERRLDKMRQKCNKTFKEFMAAQQDIVAFFTQDNTMNDIRDQYPQYSKDLIIHVLRDYAEGIADETEKYRLIFKLDRWDLGYYDE